MKSLNLLFVIAVLIALFTAGCGYQPSVAPTPIPTLPPATLPPEVFAQPEATAQMPSGAAAVSTPGSEADLAAAGGAAFEQFCVVCHNLSAETKVGPGLAGLFGRDQLPNGNPVTEDNLKEWIVTGGGAMPGQPLNDQQLAAVVAYLKEATQP